MPTLPVLNDKMEERRVQPHMTVRETARIHGVDVEAIANRLRAVLQSQTH